MNFFTASQAFRTSGGKAALCAGPTQPMDICDRWASAATCVRGRGCIIRLLWRMGAICLICGLINWPLLGSPAGASAPSGIPVRWAPWSFQENFRNGIPDWVSYPLAQDEGYDPSLYTASEGGTPALVRDVTAYGQKVLRVGLLRPLRFYANPSSVFDIRYRLKVWGRVMAARMILAAAGGEKYTARIPCGPGDHTVELNGQNFGLRAGGELIQAIIVEAEVATPPVGSHNRLTLLAFSLKAEAPPSLPLEAPELTSSPVSGVTILMITDKQRTVSDLISSPVRGVTFAVRPVTPQSPLLIRLKSGHDASVRIEDGAGKLVQDELIRGQNEIPEERFNPFLYENSPGLWSALVVANGADRRFRFLVLGKAPGHPHILLTAERLAQLRYQGSSNVLLKIVHERAVQLGSSLGYNTKAGENIALLSPDSVFPGLPQYFQLMEAYSEAIAFNALDYRLSGSSQALGTARRGLETVSQWKTWTPAWFPAHGLYTYYEVGVFTQRVAFGYDLISDKLSVPEKSRIADAFWRNSIEPTVKDYYLNDRLPTASSNHMANSVGGALAACVALDGDAPDWDKRFAPALAELIAAYESLLKGLFPGDGSEAEPAGYEDFAMEGMSWGAAALQALRIRPQGMRRMLEAFWWLRYAEFKPGEFLDTGDFGTELSALSGYAWGAENAGGPALRAFYETAKNSTLMGVFSLHHTGRILEEAPTLLDLACCTRSPAVVPNPPPSRIFPFRGSTVLRSGWGPHATVISVRVGPWFNHEHHDQGSFRVAAGGEELIAEAGYADYYKDPRYADYFTQAPGHNTVVVDGDPFSQEDYDGRYWPALGKSAKFQAHLFSQDIDFLLAGLAPAYNDGADLKRYTREYIFIKPDILVVHDRLQSSSPHRYTFFLHVPPGDRASIDDPRAVIHGNASFAALTAGSADHSWTLEHNPIPETAYRDLDRDPVMPREALRLDSPSATSGDFLVAMRFQKGPQTPATLAPFRTPSAEGFNDSSGSLVIGFRTARGALILSGTPLGTLTSDGDGLAISRRGDTTEVFADHAGMVRSAGQLLFEASPSAAAMVLRQRRTGEDVSVYCGATTNLHVHAPRRPRAVTLDKAPVPLLFSNNAVSIRCVSQGEHAIEIQY